jgi:uncharacterized protein (TIGR02246 family)
MNSDEQEIRQLIATWIDATKSGDTDTVLSLMADDVVFLVTGQPPMIGKAAFAAAMRSQSGQGRPHFDGKSEIQEIQVLGDWAYMRTTLTIVFTPPGGAPPVTRAGNTLTILKKLNGSWVLARDANMLTVVQAN